MHGHSFNKDHMSAKYEHPPEDHVTTTTWRNKIRDTDSNLITGATSKN